MKINVFNKLIQLKKKLKESEINEISDKDFIKCCQKIANHWQYKTLAQRRKITLTEQEVAVLEFLLYNNYKASTAYKWFLLSKSHPEIQHALKENKISQRNAFKLKKESKPVLQDGETMLIRMLDDLIVNYISK